MQQGTAAGVCPYYGTRQLLAEADVVLAPYSCVLQASSAGADSHGTGTHTLNRANVDVTAAAA